MPFMGQDWRSPGEQWVRTTEGWEQLTHWRMKLLEHLSESVIARLIGLAMSEEKYQESLIYYKNQPFIFVRKTGRSSRESSLHLSIADSFKKLDVTGAVKDMRRFNYVCKLLHLLLKNFHNLSGMAQKVIVNMMENVLTQVLKTQNNMRIMQSLLDELEGSLERGRYFHIGCDSLWEKHREAKDKMQGKLNTLVILARQDDGGVMMTDLPPECLQKICEHLSDHEDLVNMGHADETLQELTQDNLLWKRLCLFHFERQQIKGILRHKESLTNCDWKTLYLRLLKRHGMRDVYAEMLHLCEHCNILFWGLHGHQCLVADVKPSSISVTPKMCVDLFTK